jgi:dihydropyrimidinase
MPVTTPDDADGDLLVRGGRVVTDSEILAADVTIEGGRVAALSAPGGARSRRMSTLDADGALVLPGGVDVHTHVALPFGEFSTRDDFASASRAAALGGTTTFLEFAIPAEGETPMEAVERRLVQARGVSHLDYGFHACVARTADQTSLEDIGKAARLGVTSVKVFTAYRGIVMLELGDVRAVMDATARAGSLVMVHAETESLVERALHELRAGGTIGARSSPRARPPEAELDAARSVLGLARATGCTVYIVHVTLPEVADAIAEARARGVAAFGESCPHYLLLDDSRYSSEGAELFVCSPPLRPSAAVAELWSRVGEQLTGIHSDHCCFDTSQKGRYAHDVYADSTRTIGHPDARAGDAVRGTERPPIVARVCEAVRDGARSPLRHPSQGIAAARIRRRPHGRGPRGPDRDSRGPRHGHRLLAV